jgi:DNA-binding Xre family transcriptional regulator
MVSYRKLRILLMDRGLKITNVCKECGVSTGIATKINKDMPIMLDVLEQICVHLEIGVEDAVEFVKEK